MGEQIVEKIKAAGVVGAGGAGLPTHVKAGAKAETVLVNGASCEPLLMSDPYLMEAEIDTVVRGLEAVMECTGAHKGIICLKGKHKEAMESVRSAVQKHGNGRLEAFELKDFYPAGDEQVLVHEVLGKTVPERGIPIQIGAVVSNVESLFNVARAMEDKPVTHRYLTVGGEIRKPMVLKVPVGTLVSEVLEFAGGPTIGEYKVVDGGPMMGRVLPDTARPVTKTTSGLLVLPSDHPVVARKIMDPARVRRITNSICCQCSQCTDLCPRNLLGHSLHPHKLMRIWAGQELSSPMAREALLCSECGVCEKFACPMQVSPPRGQRPDQKNPDGRRHSLGALGQAVYGQPFSREPLCADTTSDTTARTDAIRYPPEVGRRVIRLHWSGSPSASTSARRPTVSCPWETGFPAAI